MDLSSNIFFCFISSLNFKLKISHQRIKETYFFIICSFIANRLFSTMLEYHIQRPLVTSVVFFEQLNACIRQDFIGWTNAEIILNIRGGQPQCRHLTFVAPIYAIIILISYIKFFSEAEEKGQWRSVNYKKMLKCQK